VELSIVHCEEAFACGRCEDLVVIVWRGVPTPERVQRSLDALAIAGAQAGGRMGFISVIEAGSPPPSLALLPSIARSFDALGSLVATAGVLEDRGALASRVLDAMSTIMLLALRKHPAKVTTDADEAATWMSARLGRPPADAFREHARRLVEHVRSTLPPRG
jgi:hypothetical protein